MMMTIGDRVFVCDVSVWKRNLTPRHDNGTTQRQPQQINMLSQGRFVMPMQVNENAKGKDY